MAAVSRASFRSAGHLLHSTSAFHPLSRLVSPAFLSSSHISFQQQRLERAHNLSIKNFSSARNLRQSNEAQTRPSAISQRLPDPDKVVPNQRFREFGVS